MKFLLLGADGQVGRSLRESLAGLGSVTASTRQGDHGDLACDLGDAHALNELLEATSPDVVVNAAAYTAVDRAESDRETAYAINAALPARLASWAAKTRASVVHYSTDYVFDGTANRPYREDDPTNPLGVYGSTKLEGERAIIASGCRHLILRTAWVYGQDGHNFLKTMLRLAGERPALRVVDDQQGTPTCALWIAQATAQIMNRWSKGEQGGIVHLTASGQTTWYGFARVLLAEAYARGLIPALPIVEPVPTMEYPTPARRPAFSVLDGQLAERRFDLHRPAWNETLSELLARMAPQT
ncbi:dTDP-4-dehydrorhamnose reductase [Luteibacter sahnii]|uniref:dTDP-4-dehydrorhamnose reductase n=1 Tax=Luteibacter sahnii TaxID=3021977 RepID=UPI002A69E010|nr:dTDP-4-dehydrorhamnose reductase [Luteibacter sp. PPL193]MDY1546809.1 dTDP-4-dehydrorhamnose reductase [Luteibacter sp. PPL193]